MSPGRGEIPQASPVSPVSSVYYEGYTARLALLGLGGCWGVWECTRSRLVMDMGTMCQWMWGQYATPAPQDGRYPGCCKAWRMQELTPLGQTGLGEG